MLLFPVQIKECVVRIKTLFYIESSPSIESAIEAGVIPKLIDLLSIQGCPKLRFEAVSALIAVFFASGTIEKCVESLQRLGLY